MFKFKVRPGCGSHEQNHPDGGGSKTFFPGEAFECETDLRSPGLPPGGQKFELVAETRQEVEAEPEAETDDSTELRWNA